MSRDANDLTATTAAEIPEAIPYADPMVPSARQTGLTSGITRGDVAALAVRLFGIYLLLQALPVAVLFVSAAIETPGFGISSLFAFRQGLFPLWTVYIAAFAGAGTWLVLKAPQVAAWLLPKTTGNPGVPAVAGSAHGVQAVAFSIVGLYIAASAFPDLTPIFTQYVQSQSDQAFTQLIKPAVEFIVGLILFFKAKRISGYWQQIGMARPKNLEDDSGPL